ncbi:MAG: trypsin-like peptidase domain-containing protein [Betaproteobacteria bacterium]|nr:trypsin-like peptidase domain-containing protein [Betaproteobacteria bacterium]
MHCRHSTTVAILLAALTSTPLFAQPVAASGAITSVPPAEYRPQVSAKSSPATLLLADRAIARRIELPTPSVAEATKFKAQNATTSSSSHSQRDKVRPLYVAYGRDLPHATRNVRLSELTWVATADGGRAARIEVRSPGAAAIRVAMTLATDVELTLRFVGQGSASTVFGPVSARTLIDDTARFGQFWSPVLEGDTATIELHAGAGVGVENVVVGLPRVSHHVVGGAALQKLSAKNAADIGRAGFCEIDLACVVPLTQPLVDAAKGVAKLLFTKESGAGALCTGTLLNDSLQSFTPYLFAASHCLDSAIAARTLNTFWFFDAIACDSKAVPPFVQLTGGARLLARSTDNDWALVQLNQEPPVGTFFSAWRAEPVPPNAVVTVLHHAGADLKKWSQGLVLGPVFHDEYDFIYGTFTDVRYSQGSTEGGSSGAALLTFLAAGGYYEVRGGLAGGDASCAAPSERDWFSRMQEALPYLREYLTPNVPAPAGQVVAVEFYNRTLNHYFISTNPVEIGNLDSGATVGWERTGLRFFAYNVPVAGTNPVCRFYLRPGFGDSHFYSADPQECAETQIRFGNDWIFESPNVFYIHLPDRTTGACPAATKPVFRFYNSPAINHRYTTEIVERDTLLVTPGIIPEGYGPFAVIMCSPES